jgi:hypothetical protein
MCAKFRSLGITKAVDIDPHVDRSTSRAKTTMVVDGMMAPMILCVGIFPARILYSLSLSLLADYTTSCMQNEFYMKVDRMVYIMFDFYVVDGQCM